MLSRLATARTALACLVVWYAAAATDGVPLVLAAVTSARAAADASFPCAGHDCACRTAEQCRRSCCCFPRASARSGCPGCRSAHDRVSADGCHGSHEDRSATSLLEHHLPPPPIAAAADVVSDVEPAPDLRPLRRVSDPPEKVPIRAKRA